MRVTTLFFFLCLFAASVKAQLTIHIPADRPTVQQGIDAAHDGDIVLLAPGVYNENIDFKGKAITVTSSGNPKLTEIHGGTGSATVLFDSGETRSSVLSNLTISGGGDGTSYLIEGGVFILHASPTIHGNIITGAGCYGIGSVAGAPLIEANEISRTHVNPVTAACGEANGSGIWIDGTDNTQRAFPTSQGHSPQILHNTIELNTESGSAPGDTLGGAGIAVRRGAIPLIEYNVIRNNVIGAKAQFGGSGGGILVFAAGAVIANNLITGNTAVSGGGGVSVRNYGLDSSFVFLLSNTIADNRYLPLDEGGIVFGGEQLFYGGSAPVALDNNILSGASASSLVSCSEVPSPADPTHPLPVQFVTNDIFNASGPAIGTPDGTPCEVPLNMGNLYVDPRFVDAASDDYHLLPVSPDIDTGAANAAAQAALDSVPFTTDLDGNSRIQNATGKLPPTIDIGAYEFNGIVSPLSTTSLTSSLNPSIVGQPVTFSAYTTSSGGTPTGTITFLDGSTPLATITLDTSATSGFTTARLGAGTHTITAQFQSTGTTGASSAQIAQVVTAAPVGTVTLTSGPNPANLGQPVTLSAQVTSSDGSAPSGTLTFRDGTSVLNTAPVSTSGKATFTTTTLTVGDHLLSAVFLPAGLSTSPTSSIVRQTILASSFTLQLTPNTLTLQTGAPGTINVALQSLGSFAGTMHLSATHLPAYAGIAFSPAALSLAAGASATATLQLTTAVDTLAQGPISPHRGREGFTLAVLITLPFAFRRRRPSFRLLAALVAFALAQTLLGCTDRGIPFHRVAPGTYAVPISATDSQGHQQSAMLTLVITP